MRGISYSLTTRNDDSILIFPLNKGHRVETQIKRKVTTNSLILKWTLKLFFLDARKRKKRHRQKIMVFSCCRLLFIYKNMYGKETRWLTPLSQSDMIKSSKNNGFSCWSHLYLYWKKYARVFPWKDNEFLNKSNRNRKKERIDKKWYSVSSCRGF